MKQMGQTNKLNIHAGHRQRLKNKASNFGLSAFNDHEVLELMLTYVIPQKDTNPLAHTLLNEFGSLYKVFEASEFDLLKVQGVGKETARYIKFIGMLSDRIEKDKCSQYKNRKILRSTKQCVDYFLSNYGVKDTEHCYFICLDEQHMLIKTIEYEGFDKLLVRVDLNDLVNRVSKLNAKEVVMVHTHPHGLVVPSEEDIKSTCLIFKRLFYLNIMLKAHLIFNESTHYNMDKEIQHYYKYLVELEAELSQKNNTNIDQIIKTNRIE